MNGKSQLCWKCKNAYANRCCWIGQNKAVNGWTAKKTIVKSQNITCPTVETYFITACPNFIKDKEETSRTELAKSLAQKYGCTSRTVYKLGLMPKGEEL